MRSTTRLAGGLLKQVEGRSQGLTWRDEAVRLASPARGCGWVSTSASVPAATSR
jgi:hypothetical protein